MVTKVPRDHGRHALTALYDWLDQYVTNATDVDSGGSTLPAVAAIDQGAALIGYADGTFNWSQIVRPVLVQINQTDFLADTPQYIPRPLFNGGSEGSGFGGGGGSVLGWVAVAQKDLSGPGGGATHGTLKLQTLISGTVADITGSSQDLGNGGGTAGSFFSRSGIWAAGANLGVFDSIIVQPTHGGLTAGALNVMLYFTNFANSGS